MTRKYHVTYSRAHLLKDRSQKVYQKQISVKTTTAPQVGTTSTRNNTLSNKNKNKNKTVMGTLSAPRQRVCRQHFQLETFPVNINTNPTAVHTIIIRTVALAIPTERRLRKKQSIKNKNTIVTVGVAAAAGGGGRPLL